MGINNGAMEKRFEGLDAYFARPMGPREDFDRALEVIPKFRLG
jgi:hypothetical protein